MEASNEMGLKLIGFWASPFCLVVEVALKLKGFSYDYQEENLEEGKSESLLRYNPIYKSVPVFIHDARPIVESLVILEYLEDLLREPPLLPADPFARARVRFWVDFFYKKEEAAQVYPSLSWTTCSCMRQQVDEKPVLFFFTFFSSTVLN